MASRKMDAKRPKSPVKDKFVPQEAADVSLAVSSTLNQKLRGRLPFLAQPGKETYSKKFEKRAAVRVYPYSVGSSEQTSQKR